MSNRRGISNGLARTFYVALVLAFGARMVSAATEVGSFSLTATTQHGILVWEGSSGSSSMTPLPLTNGQLLIGSTGADPVAATIGGSANGVTATTGAGTITIGNTARTYTTKTANYTVLSTDTNTVFDNAGAAGTVNFTLPTAAAGLTFTFNVSTAQTVQVTAGSSTTIRIGGSVTASAGNVQNATVGGTVTVVGASSTAWQVTGASSAWTVN